MKLEGWFCNTNVEEREATLRLLDRMQCRNVAVVEGEAGPEYTYTQYCDDDLDTLRVLAVCLHYNDRTQEQIVAILEGAQKLLDEHKRR